MKKEGLVQFPGILMLLLMLACSATFSSCQRANGCPMDIRQVYQYDADVMDQELMVEATKPDCYDD